jgi:hypothetical protein
MQSNLSSFLPLSGHPAAQRDLKAMLDKGILVSEAATHHQEYRLK